MFPVQAILASTVLLAVSAGDTVPPLQPSGPITITQGGTYSGSWLSSDSTPAIEIATRAPVTIVNSAVANIGDGALIRADAGANVTITRTTLNGGNGRAFYANGIKSLTIRNCSINKTSGIRLDGAAGSAAITITRNRVRNIQRAGYNTAFTQLADVTTATIEISWNEVINDFGQSGVEDNINLYRTAFAQVHDNYIQGAYPVSPGSGFSGSGIMVDSVGSHHNRIYSNQIVDTTNAGIGIFGGHDNQVYDNRLVFDGRLWTGEKLASANVGVFVWNGARDPAWANNQAYGNHVAWMNARGTRNDWWLPHCSGSCKNVRLAGPLGRVSEVAEYFEWARKLLVRKVTIGV